MASRLKEWAKRVSREVWNACNKGNSVIAINGEQIAAGQRVLERETRSFVGMAWREVTMNDAVDLARWLDASPAPGPGAEPTPTGMEPARRCTRTIAHTAGTSPHEFDDRTDAAWNDPERLATAGIQRCPYVFPVKPTPTGMRPGQRCTWSVDNCDGHYYSESEEALWIAGKLQAEHGERCPYIEPTTTGGGPTCETCGSPVDSPAHLAWCSGARKGSP